MKWHIIATVFAKELKETLRDRRTLFIMIVLPVLLYPAMLVVLEQITLFGQRSLEADAVRVAVVGEGGGAADFLARADGVSVVRTDAASAEALHSERVDAIVVLPNGTWSSGGTNRVELLYDGTRDRSGYARGLVASRLGEWADTLLARRLAEAGLPAGYAAPLVVADSSVATAEQMGGYALGRFLPILLILMTVLGTFYPAIDLAAGEKERGTLEPLLATPVPADLIVVGKFAAAAVMGFLAALLNLASMLLTFQSGIVGFTRSADLDFHLPAGAIAVILVMLALLSVFFASLFLGIAVRARSFKEAQNSLTPVYTLSIMPAVLAMMPGIGFSTTMALVPVGGVAFLFRALMSGTVELEPAITAIASTVLYAALALVYAAKTFGREDVLFGGAGDGEAEPVTFAERLRRWRERTQRVPAPATALLLAAAIGVLFFYFGRRLAVTLGEDGLVASQLLLLALPALALVVLGRYDVRRTLALRGAPPRAFVAALLIGLGGIPLGWTIAWLQGFVVSMPEEYLRALSGLLTATDARRLGWLVFAVALVPAVCEELVFRGVLLQSFAARMRMPAAIVLSAAVFGAFHLSFETAIRFLPTLWIGLLLGYVVWHTRSLYTSVLMHFLNNALVVLLVSTPGLQQRLLGPDGTPPWGIVAVGALLLAAGVRLLPKREAEAAGREVPANSPVAIGTQPAR